MPDLRPRLEWIAERVRIEPDAFERLERARRRHDRNRRIAAGTVALLVAIAGSVAAFSAFRGSGGQTVAGEGGSGFFALWPEQTPESLAAAQARVDSGDRDSSWRTIPASVAGRFAIEELQWPPPVTISPVPGSDPETDDVISFRVEIQLGAACDQLVADATCPTSPVTVTMERLGRPDGLWSIVEVHGDDLALPLNVGAEVVGGTALGVPTSLPDGTKVSMGVAFGSACGATGIDESVEVSGGMLHFTVPDVPDGCVGYVYALTPKTEVGSEPIGSILFTDASAVPAIGYLVDEVSAVPVLFESGAGTGRPDVAEFTCDGTGRISPSSLTVDAQPDGVHVAVTDTGDAPVSFSVGSLEAPLHVAGGDGADPGERKETVWQLPPGRASVSCSLVSDGGTDTSPVADLRVEDPTGSYVPVGMTCPRTAMVSADVPGATGVQGDTVEISKQHLAGLEYDDAVERAGYPDSELPVVRVVRGGDVVATATFRSDGDGGWLVETLDVCAGVQIDWSDEIAGVSGPMGPSGTA